METPSIGFFVGICLSLSSLENLCINKTSVKQNYNGNIMKLNLCVLHMSYEYSNHKIIYTENKKHVVNIYTFPFKFYFKLKLSSKKFYFNFSDFKGKTFIQICSVYI